MYHPVDDDPADLIDNDAYEFIEILNTGTSTPRCSNFFFEGITYSFPAGTMIGPGEYVVLIRDEAAFTSRYPGVSYDGVYLSKLSNGGEKIRLKDATGTTLISVEYDDDPSWVISPDGMGYSLVNIALDEDPDLSSSWRASSNLHGSPARPILPFPIKRGSFLTKSSHTPTPLLKTSIELYNNGSQTVDLSGWYLSDDARDALGNLDANLLKKYQIPAGTNLAPGEYFVFYENQFNGGSAISPFALTEYGERVYLSSADGSGNLTGLILPFEFGATDNGVSFGRVPTSIGDDLSPLLETTFGVTFPTNLPDFRSGTGALNSPAKVGPVVISEIMYNPPTHLSEFVELQNISSNPVDLTDWDIDGIAVFSFPAGTTLQPGERLLLIDTAKITAADFRTDRGVPASVQIFGALYDLGNSGEHLRLEKPNPDPLAPDILVDRVHYNDKDPWPTEADGSGPSLERFVLDGYGNEPLHWRTTITGGTPGTEGSFTEGLAIAKETGWKYYAAESTPATNWQDADYNDSSWPSGDGSLGYGEPFIQTIIPYGSDPANRFPTTYFRKTFVINDDPALLTEFLLSALYDDGFVAYLNGTEIARRSLASGTVSYSTLAIENEASLYEEIDLMAWSSLLVTGTNVLAVEVHQSAADSADLVWDAELTYSIGTLPADSDGDGMPDDWETANSLNPADPSDAALDSDGDGFTNHQEFLTGTNPHDFSSRLCLTNLMETPAGNMLLSWHSVPGKTYRVHYSSDLSSWFTFGITGDITAQSAISQFTDTSPSAMKRFYRVELIAP